MRALFLITVFLALLRPLPLPTAAAQSPRAQARPEPQPPPIGPAELAARRARALEEMKRLGGDKALMILRAPAADHYAGDVIYPYRPDDDLYYLSGIAEEDCALLLSVEEVKDRGHEILFYTPTPQALHAWTGEGLSARRASELSGIPAASVLELKELKEQVARLLGAQLAAPHPFHARAPATPKAAPLFFDAGRDFAPGTLPSEPYGFLLESLGSTAFHLELKRPAEVVHPLRQIKSAAEIALLQKAIDATCEAEVRAMKTARPGIFEYEVRALIEGTFVEAGCRGWGFPSIVATGPNTCILHYQDDRRRGEEGELLLMDIGAEYGFYSADVTRTLPLSGRFSPRQRQIYSLVLGAQLAGIAAVKPGVALKDVHNAAKAELAAGLKRLGLIEKDEEVSKYFLHGTSHGLGLNVHDPMPKEALAPGMVITVEPGLYLPAEKIGVRIEDDVLVTESGAVVLSAKAPRSPDEIEALMRQRTF
jgi:Xaa-Pro aminopeptidase